VPHHDHYRLWYRYHHLFADALRGRLAIWPLAAAGATEAADPLCDALQAGDSELAVEIAG
jgi:ATP/maltotriose-dependent transcriptional regulator MalT